MKHLLDNFSKARVLVVGDVMLDRYWWGSVSRISPEAPVPVVRLERMTSMPGGAANVAVNVNSIGGTASLIGIVGDDEAGLGLKAELVNLGIKNDRLITSHDRRTNVKTRVVAHAQQVTRVDIEDTFPLTDNEGISVLKEFHEAIEEIDVLLLSDYAKGVLGSGALREMIDTANDLGKTVLVDPKGKDFSKYRGASMLTPNRREAAEACKLDLDADGLVSIAGQQLLEELELCGVVITESENGMTLFEEDGKVRHYDAHTHEVYDVTGAGDSVIACLAVGLGSGLNMEQSCEIANVVGGLSVQMIGTSNVSIEMIRSEIEQTASLKDASAAR